MDAVEPLLLRQVIGIPSNTSNAPTLEMTDKTKTLVEDLNEKGFKFDPIALKRYEDHREKRAMKLVTKGFTDGPAFKPSK